MNIPQIINVGEREGTEFIVDVFVSCCAENFFFLTKSGELYCSGRNNNGELGLNHAKYIENPIKWNELKGKKIIYVSVGDCNSYFLTSNNQLYSSGTGNNKHGQLGIGKTYNEKENSLIPVLINSNDYENEKIVMISAGCYFSFIQTIKGKIFAFGWNEDGRLGDNRCDDLKKPTNTFLELMKNDLIIESNVGGDHSIILTQNEKVFAVGYNFSGQIGIGSEEEDILIIEIIFQLNVYGIFIGVKIIINTLVLNLKRLLC